MNRFWIMGAAITAVMALGVAAKADTVTFTTWGSFSVNDPTNSDVYVDGSGSLKFYGSTVTFTGGSGNYTLSDPNVSQSFNVTQLTNGFGFFTWTGDANSNNNQNNITIGSFTLTIAQTSPMGGSEPIEAKVTGWVRKSTASAPDELLFEFGSVEVPGSTPPNVKYTVNQLSFKKLSNQQTKDASLEGTVLYTPAPAAAPVPLPASAWMGVGLLGGVGVARVVRRKA